MFNENSKVLITFLNLQNVFNFEKGKMLQKTNKERKKEKIKIKRHKKGKKSRSKAYVVFLIT